MPRGDMKLSTEVPTTRRERATNWGDSQTVAGGARAALFTMSSQQSDSVTLYAQAALSVPVDLVGTADFRPIVRVSWGQGGSSVQSDFDCTYRQRIPLASAIAEVSCWIAALPLPMTSPAQPIPGGNQLLGNERGPFAAPAAVTCDFRCFAAQGHDSVDLFPTIWLSQTDLDFGVYASGPVRLASFRAYNPGPGEVNGSAAALVYLLLFDEPTAPAPGDVAVESMFLPYTTSSTNVPSLQSNLVAPSLGQTRAFGRGLSWGVSTDPFVYAAPNPAVAVFTAAEIAS